MASLRFAGVSCEAEQGAGRPPSFPEFLSFFPFLPKSELRRFLEMLLSAATDAHTENATLPSGNNHS